SLHVVGEKGEWCDYPLFPSLFRKAGYHVTFITNQFLPKAKQAGTRMAFLWNWAWRKNLESPKKTSVKKSL
ncbi:MAG: hypothetical protein ACFNQA_05235, partial [Flavobacteriaceae bacterium]